MKKFLQILLTASFCVLFSVCGNSNQTSDNKEVELLRKENELDKKEAELAKKELEISKGNTANINANDIKQSPSPTSIFDFSTLKGKTLNQIFTPSGLNEIKKLISADSKKRLIRVKSKVLSEMKSGQGGWNGGTEIWFEKDVLGSSFEDGWQAGMKREYSAIELEKHFTMTKSGITFLYDTPIGFPRSVLELEPSSKYFYSWAVLKPYLIQSSPISSLVK